VKFMSIKIQISRNSLTNTSLNMVNAVSGLSSLMRRLCLVQDWKPPWTKYGFCKISSWLVTFYSLRKKSHILFYFNIWIGFQRLIYVKQTLTKTWVMWNCSTTVAGTFLYYYPIFKKTKLFVKKIKKLSSSALTLKYNYEFNYPI
jgi:hypothetical protein